MPKTKTKTKKTLRSSTSYQGGTKIIQPVLSYHKRESDYRDDGMSSCPPVRSFVFNPDNTTAFGEAHCGSRLYFATNKADARAVIDFLKSCYDIK